MKRNLLTKQYALRKSRILLCGKAVLMISGLTFRLHLAEITAAQNRIHLRVRALLGTLADLSPVNKIAVDSPIVFCYGYHALASADNGHTASLITWFVLPQSLCFTCFRTVTGGDGYPDGVNFSGWRQTAINLTPANNPIYGIFSAAEEATFFLINGKQVHLPTPGEEDHFPLHSILQS
ncbi:MAG: hypothetical protein ACOX7C_01775 [Brevefilum sp.]